MSNGDSHANLAFIPESCRTNSVSPFCSGFVPTPSGSLTTGFEFCVLAYIHRSSALLTGTIASKYDFCSMRFVTKLTEISFFLFYNFMGRFIHHCSSLNESFSYEVKNLFFFSLKEVFYVYLTHRGPLLGK